MLTFILVAASLLVAAVLVVAIPLLRRTPDSAAAPWTALAVAVVLVVGSALLYVAWSSWSWRAAPAADSPQGMVAHLARRLERDPNDLAGWLTLGRSYLVLQEYPLALRAFERAERLSGGTSAEALTGQAEALALQDDDELAGRAARLVDRALAIDPGSGQALFLGALVAMRRGELPLARERLEKLLALNPPANLRSMLEQQLAAIDAQLSGAAAPASTPLGADAAGAAAAAVHVRVTLAPGLAANTADAPLFVFVRNPAAAGPPLAVKRLASHFPQDVELTSADAVIPGHSFAPGSNVQVIARIARSGNPKGASGDPYGEIAYKVGQDRVLGLVIDRVMP
jgi:cytochrome c-type biogenesis protein CcmH